MLNDLAEVLKGNEAEGEPATLRRLQCNDECRSALHAALATFIHATLHDQYPGADHGAPDPAYFIRGLLHLPKKYPNTYFCSEIGSRHASREGRARSLDGRQRLDSGRPPRRAASAASEVRVCLRRRNAYRNRLIVARDQSAVARRWGARKGTQSNRRGSAGDADRVRGEAYGSLRVRGVPLAGEALGFGNLGGRHQACNYVATLDRVLSLLTGQPRG